MDINVELLKNKISSKLLNTHRPNIDNVVNYMGVIKFWTSPMSTKSTLACPGGLAYHSFMMWKSLSNLAAIYRDNKLTEESICIIGFLHDLCKAGLYIPSSSEGYVVNTDHPSGHAKLTLKILELCEFKLTPLEEVCIRYHMGSFSVFGLDKFEEYSFEEYIQAIDEHKEVLLTACADNLSAKFFI